MLQLAGPNPNPAEFFEGFVGHARSALDRRGFRDALRELELHLADPEANLVRLVLEGGTRLQIRPSGTEPKVKLYGEAVDLDPAELDRLLHALAE